MSFSNIEVSRGKSIMVGLWGGVEIKAEIPKDKVCLFDNFTKNWMDVRVEP